MTFRTGRQSPGDAIAQAPSSAPEGAMAHAVAFALQYARKFLEEEQVLPYSNSSLFASLYSANRAVFRSSDNVYPFAQMLSCLFFEGEIPLSQGRTL